jgi:hypothetical protein
MPTLHAQFYTEVIRTFGGNRNGFEEVQAGLGIARHLCYRTLGS